MPALLGKKNDSTQSSNNDLSAKIQELTQSLNNEKDRKLCKAIYKNVTEQDQRKLSDIARECKQLFKQGADPSVLAKLEELLIGQEKCQKYYIKNFLPALLQEITQSKELGLEKIEQILRITSKIVKQSDEYEHYIQFLGTLLGKIRESSASCEDDKKKEKLQKIGEIITEIISGSNYQIDLRNSQINGQGNAGTPKPSVGPGSRANPPVLNKKSPLSSPVSGRRGSISTTLSSVGGDNDLQREEIEDQPQPPKQNPEEKPKKQENENSGGQANPIGNGNPQKRNEGQPQLEQSAKKEQNTQENENSEPTKQPNNRNFRIALATCCAFSVGCLIAGAVTLGMVGAGLLVMSVVFAIAAAVTRYLPPPSNELTSTDLSPLIDDSKQR